MILKSNLGRFLITNEKGKWFGYGLDSSNEPVGCVEIAPPTCNTLYDVFLYVKNHISSSTVIERR